MNNYDLDLVWYYTAAGLTWDACLKKTGVQLELLSDPDMLLMFEQGIREGVLMISKRYAKANNKYMIENSIRMKNQNSSNILMLTISMVGR